MVRYQHRKCYVNNSAEGEKEANETFLIISQSVEEAIIPGASARCDTIQHQTVGQVVAFYSWFAITHFTSIFQTKLFGARPITLYATSSLCP